MLLESKPRQTCNALLLSAPGHPFWLFLLRRIGGGVRGGEDPVGSTGPRVLEQAVREWALRHACGGSADDPTPCATACNGVQVVEPDVLFPTFDPMQAGTLKQRCAALSSSPRSSWRLPRASGVPKRLLPLASRACERLRTERFEPAVGATAFTNHLWSHTWIAGAQKVSLRETFSVPVE